MIPLHAPAVRAVVSPARANLGKKLCGGPAPYNFEPGVNVGVMAAGEEGRVVQVQWRILISRYEGTRNGIAKENIHIKSPNKVRGCAPSLCQPSQPP